MSSRSEYFLNMSKEFSELSTVHLVATGLSIFVFLTAVVLLILRRQERDEFLSHLPFKD